MEIISIRRELDASKINFEHIINEFTTKKARNIKIWKFIKGLFFII